MLDSILAQTKSVEINTMSSSDFSDVDEPMLAAPPSAASAIVASSVTPAAVPGNDITFYAAVGLPVPFDVPALEVPQVEYRYGGSHFPWKPLPLVPLTPELAPDDLQGGYTCRLTAPIHIRRDGQSGASATKTEDSKLQFRFKGRAGVSPDDTMTIDAVEDIDEQSRVAVAAWPGRESSPLLSPSGPAKLPLVAGVSPFPHPPTKSVLYLQILPGDMTADPVLSLIRFPRHDQLVQIAKRKAEAEEEKRQQAAKAARDKEDREKRMKEDQERRAQQEKERKLRDEQERLEKEKVAKEKAIRDAISEAESAQMLSSSKPERKDTLVPATVTPIRTLSDVPLSSHQSNATSAPPQQPASLGALVSKPAQPQQETPISEEWSRSAKPAPPPQPKPAPPAPKKFVGEELLEDDEVSPPKRHHRQQQSDIVGGAPSLPRLIITPLPKPLSSSAVPPPPPFEPPSMVNSQFTRCGGMGMGLLSGGLVISTDRPSDGFYRYSNGKGTWEELRFGAAPSTPDVAAASVGFAGRHGHSACFSPVDHRVYIYGGMGLGGFDPVREAQALRSLSAKQKIQYFSEMSKEGSRKQIGYLDDLWAVDTEDLTLTRLVFPDDEVGLDGETSNGLPLRAQRSYRYQQSSVIDAEGNLVLVGGRTATFLAEIPDANSPDRRVSHTKSSDRHKAAEVTVFEEDVTFAAEETCCSLQYLDVCNVILASTPQRLRPKKLRNQPLWRVVEATGDVPSPRFGHSMDRSKSGDPLGVHAYLFGGCSSAATHLNDLFSLNTDTWIWTRISLAAIPRFVALQSPSVISATVAGRLCLVVSGTTAQVADPDDEGSRDNSDDSDADGSKMCFTPKFQCVVVDLSSSTSSKARPVGLGGTGNPATGRGPSVSFVSASAPIYGHAVAVTSTAQRHNQYSGRLPCKTRSLLSLTLFGGQSSEVADLPFVASAKVNANGLVSAVSEVSKGLGMGGGSSSHTTTMSLREDIHGQGVQLCVSAQLRATKGWTVGRMSMLPDFVDPASIAASTTFRDSAAPLDRNIVSASKPREGWQIQASVGRLSTLTSRQRAALVASHPEKFKEELAKQQDKEHRERQKRAVPQEKIQEVAQRLHDHEMAIRAKRKAQAQKEEEERIQADVRKTTKPRSKDEDNRDEDWWRERFLKSKVTAATSPPRPQTATTPRRITSEKQLADANAQLYYTAVKNKNETMKKLEDEVCGVPEKVPRLTQEAMQKSIGRLYRGPPSPLSSHKGRPQSATARTHHRRVAL